MCVPGCLETMRAAPRLGLVAHRQFRAVVMSAGGGSPQAAAPSAPTSVDLAPADLASPHAKRLAGAIGPFVAVLDLTHPLSPAFPVFPGDPAIEVMPYATLAEDGYNMKAWHLVEHTGTHLDAPIHFCDSGASVETIDAATLVAPLAVIDVTAQARDNPDYQLSCDDLSAWEAQHGRLPQGACVAMHSGWGEFAIADPERFVGRDEAGTLHFPGFAPDAARWLMAERRIVGLAVDTLSLDHGPSLDFPTHQVWLPSGRWGLENVANLDQAPPAGAVLVVGLPKVTGATGAPVRLLAMVTA